MISPPSEGAERGDGSLRAEGVVSVRRIRRAGSRVGPSVCVPNTGQVNQKSPLSLSPSAASHSQVDFFFFHFVVSVSSLKDKGPSTRPRVWSFERVDKSRRDGIAGMAFGWIDAPTGCQYPLKVHRVASPQE